MKKNLCPKVSVRHPTIMLFKLRARTDEDVILAAIEDVAETTTNRKENEEKEIDAEERRTTIQPIIKPRQQNKRMLH